MIVFCFLLLVVLYHIYLRVKEHSLSQHLAKKAKNKLDNFRKREGQDDDMDDNCDANVRTVASNVASIYSDRYDELREPLLDPDP